MSFSKTKEILDLPYLIELQRGSYKKFLEEGLREIFDEFSPIVQKATNGAERFVLEFGEYKVEEPHFSARACKSENLVTYNAPLRVKVRLTIREKGDLIKEDEIFMGDIPLMTDTGSFIINGAERVVVSQLVRSPGVYFEKEVDKDGEITYNCTVIPKNGAWMEFEQKSAKDDASGTVLYVKVDRKKKVTSSLMLRAIGLEEDQQLLDIFGDDMKGTIGKDGDAEHENPKKELYKTIKNGEIITDEGV
ncbi:MAG: DNA-directed RNA polymerase subunit beta, partial [Clostridia bacterium]|nr:DNA-directed RNA polymerase subunit beta [Clostridia bacterium]